MAAQQGRSFLLEFNTASTTFVAVAGQRNTSFTINNELVDITNKDDETTEGALHRVLLEQAGVGTCSISVDGVYLDDTNYNTMKKAAIENTHVNMKLQSAGTAVDGALSGSFAIASISESGVYNGEQTYSMTLESAGEFEYTLAP